MVGRGWEYGETQSRTKQCTTVSSKMRITVIPNITALPDAVECDQVQSYHHRNLISPTLFNWFLFLPAAAPFGSREFFSLLSTMFDSVRSNGSARNNSCLWALCELRTQMLLDPQPEPFNITESTRSWRCQMEVKGDQSLSNFIVNIAPRSELRC